MILERVENFLSSTDTDIDPAVIDEFGELAKGVLRKHFVDKPSREFTLRMSNIGRPTCQLQMEKNGVTPVSMSPWDRMKMVYGDLVEALAVAILKASGVSVEEYQKPVTLRLKDGTEISGTYDVKIEGKLWDIKSASEYSFLNKFKDKGLLSGDDSFGYVAQATGYAVADGIPLGGWIAIDKTSGEWTVLEVPEDFDYTAELDKIENTVQTVNSDKPFERCFTDVEETYYKAPTGNRYLGFECSYCPFKYDCWPTLKFAPMSNSKAMYPPYKYYTKLESQGSDVNTVKESERESITT